MATCMPDTARTCAIPASRMMSRWVSSVTPPSPSTSATTSPSTSSGMLRVIPSRRAARAPASAPAIQGTSMTSGGLSATLRPVAAGISSGGHAGWGVEL